MQMIKEKLTQSGYQLADIWRQIFEGFEIDGDTRGSFS